MNPILEYLKPNLDITDPKTWSKASKKYNNYSKEIFKISGSHYHSKQNRLMLCGYEYSRRWIYSSENKTNKSGDENLLRIHDLRHAAKEVFQFRHLSKCPFDICLRMLVPETYLSKQTRATYAHVLRYAFLHNVDLDWLPGFVYQSGGLKKAEAKGKALTKTIQNESYEEWWSGRMDRSKWEDFISTIDGP